MTFTKKCLRKEKKWDYGKFSSECEFLWEKKSLSVKLKNPKLPVSSYFVRVNECPLDLEPPASSSLIAFIHKG